MLRILARRVAGGGPVMGRLGALTLLAGDGGTRTTGRGFMPMPAPERGSLPARTVAPARDAGRSTRSMVALAVPAGTVEAARR